MLKQTIHYTDYNDQPREVVEYFNLNEAEIIEMETSSPNGLQADMQNAILSNDAGKVLGFITMLVQKSYGKKSADGIYFEKSPELLQKFVNSAYYSDFLLGLIEDNGAKGQEFVQQIMPKKLLDRAAAQVQGQKVDAPDRTIHEPSARETFAMSKNAETEVKTETAPEPSPSSVTENEWLEFKKWQNQQKLANPSSAPASPDAFRIREEDPYANGQ